MLRFASHFWALSHTPVNLLLAHYQTACNHCVSSRGTKGSSMPRVWFIFQPKVQNLEDQDFSLGSRLKTKRRLRRAMLFFPPSLPSFSSLFLLLLFWPFPLATGPGSRLFQPTISWLHWPELHPWPLLRKWTYFKEIDRGPEIGTSGVKKVLYLNTRTDG